MINAGFPFPGDDFPWQIIMYLIEKIAKKKSHKQTIQYHHMECWSYEAAAIYLFFWYGGKS